MAPEVSGQDHSDGELRDGAGSKPQRFYIGEDFWKRMNDARLKRSMSVPCSRQPEVIAMEATPREELPGDDLLDSQDQLQLLWSLWEAQRQLMQEEDVIRQADLAQSELCMRNEVKRQEIREAEAELHEGQDRTPMHFPSGLPVLSLTPPPLPSSASPVADTALEHEVAALRQRNEMLQESLREIEAKLRDWGADRRRFVQCQPERAPADLTCPREIESLESELSHLKRVEARRVEDHRFRMDELQEELREVENKVRGQRWALRDELAEVCTEQELLQSELDGALRARVVALDRLSCEEQLLISEVKEMAQEEAESTHKLCKLSQHLESEPRHRTRSNSITTFGSSVQSSEYSGGLAFSEKQAYATGSLFNTRGSLFDELQETPVSATASGDGSPAVEAAAMPFGGPAEVAQVGGSRPTARRSKLRAKMMSVAAFRLLGPLRPRGSASPGDACDAAGRLDVIGEGEGDGGRCVHTDSDPVSPTSPLPLPWEAEGAEGGASASATPKRSVKRGFGVSSPFTPPLPGSGSATPALPSARTIGGPREDKDSPPLQRAALAVEDAMKVCQEAPSEADGDGDALWRPRLLDSLHRLAREDAKVQRVLDLVPETMKNEQGELARVKSEDLPELKQLIEKWKKESDQQLVVLKRLAIERGMAFAEVKNKTYGELQAALLHQGANRGLSAGARGRLQARLAERRRSPRRMTASGDHHGGGSAPLSPSC